MSNMSNYVLFLLLSLIEGYFSYFWNAMDYTTVKDKIIFYIRLSLNYTCVVVTLLNNIHLKVTFTAKSEHYVIFI